MIHRIASLLLLLALLPAGCNFAPGPRWLPTPYVDQRPDFIEAEDLKGVLVLSGKEPGVGTGVVVADDLVITALHVWQRLGKHNPVVEGPFAGGGRIRLGSQWSECLPVANGVMDQEHGDWVLLRVRKPHWSAPAILALHPKALEEMWEPQPGMDLYFAGYATKMFVDGSIDPLAPAPMVQTRVSTPGLADKAELRDGWLADDRRMKLGGMSGGAVCTWNATEERLELIGIFSGQVEIQRKSGGLFGIRFTTHRDDHLVFHRLPEGLSGMLESDG